MPSRLGVRRRIKGILPWSDDASSQAEVIKRDGYDEQATTAASLVNSSTLLADSALSTASASPTTPAVTTTPAILPASAPSEPVSTSKTPTGLAERLWDRAYDDLKITNAELVQAYEEILSRKLSGQGFDSPVTGSKQNVIEQHDTHARRNQMRQLIHEGLDKTAKEAKVKEAIGTATDFIFSARAIISSAVQAAPQAALAWTGVCVALEMIQNPIAATEANRNGIEYVIKRMGWYWKLSSVVLKDNTNDDSISDVRQELETQVIDLYKVLLSYEIKSVCSYYRNRFSELLRDLVSLNDWNGDMKAIKNAERVFHDDFEMFAGLETAAGINQLVGNAKIQHAAETAKEDQQCIKDLRLTDPSEDKRRIEQTKGGLLQESYSWILENPDYQEWQDSGESRLLWIKGDPGKGKTMLLCGIINELSQQPNQFGFVSYFFCQATDQRLNNAAAVLRGLLFMLVNQQPSLICHLREKYDQAGEKLFEGPNTWYALSEIFVAILQDRALKSTYLVIDALDECVSDKEKLLDLIVHISSTETRVKWIVSSRNWLQIEERLQLDEQKVNLSLELNAESISTAVKIYIGKKVDRLSRLKNYDGKTLSEVQGYLSKNANDTFLWVALVCKNLEKYSRWNVLKSLRTFPPGLDSLYGLMLEQMITTGDDDDDDASLCKQILAVMMSVYRPVTLQELGCLIEIRQELSNNIDYLKEMVSLCGSFLTIREDTIYFVHQSAKDYLSEKEDVIFSSGRGDLHHTIFSLSLQAMSRTLRKNIYDLPYLGSLIDDGIRMPDTDPLSSIRYSCVHWVDHFREGHSVGMKAIHLKDLDDDGIAASFLRKHLLHWFEALGLLQQVSAGVVSITVLETLLAIQAPKADLLSFLQDAHRFALHNRRAIEIAPLQVYSSALIFSPMQSLVRRAFYEEIPSWVLKWPVAENTWSPCLQTLEGHTNSVNHVAFSVDRKQIASGSDDMTVKIWDIATGVCIQTLYGHTSYVFSVVFFANSQKVISGSGDHTIKIWDLATSTCVQTLKGHNYVVRSVAILANGQVASGSSDGTIKVWDIATGTCVQTLKGHGDWVCSLAILANGQVASGSSDKTIKIWDIATGTCVQTLKGHGNWVCSLAILANGQVASGSDDETIKIWDLATSACVQTLKGHNDYIRSLAILSNGQVASGSNDKTIKIWDTATGACVQTLTGHNQDIRSVAVLAAGQIASGSLDRTIKIWDAATSTSVRGFDSHKAAVESMALSFDGLQVASGSLDNTVKVWNVDTGECVQTLEGHTTRVTSVTFLNHGQVASGSSDKTVKIWDVDAGTCVQTFEGHTGRVRSIASAADGQHIASGADDCTVKIWDVTAGVCLWTLEGHGGFIYSATFSVDAKQLVSGSYDNTIKIWDVATGACTRTLSGHRLTIASVAISSDGRHVASGSWDGTVKVWDVAAGACIQTLKLGEVNFLSFDPTIYSRIHSNFGTIDLNLDLDSAPVTDKPDGKLPALVAICGYGINEKREWITKDGKPLLWLPAEYRPEASTILGSTITLGCSSGRVFRMKFSEAGPDI